VKSKRLFVIAAVSVMAATTVIPTIARPVTAQAQETPAAQEPTFNWGTSRPLRTCPDKTAPAKGRMTVALATAYVACEYEEEPPYNARILFVDILSLKIASQTRRVNTGDVALWPDIDQKKPIYILSGSIVVHACGNITENEYGPKLGSNCIQTRVPKAKGNCRVDVFGEWTCYLGGYDPKPRTKEPAPA
jgi:hypothetical protein